MSKINFEVETAENGYVVRARDGFLDDRGAAPRYIRGPFIAPDFASVTDFVTAVLASEKLSEGQRNEKREENMKYLKYLTLPAGGVTFPYAPDMGTTTRLPTNNAGTQLADDIDKIILKLAGGK
jgi:hypothetical protein